jgi:hypothetical protein
MAEMDDGLAGQSVALAEWPGGLSCMECRRPLFDGDRYVERLAGFMGDTPTAEIVCVPCGRGVTPS